jgi:hypothetical protein
MVASIEFHEEPESKEIVDLIVVLTSTPSQVILQRN